MKAIVGIAIVFITSWYLISYAVQITSCNIRDGLAVSTPLGVACLNKEALK